MDLAQLDPSVSSACDYCGHANGDIEHTLWSCTFFQPDRLKQDAEIATLPAHYLCIAVKRVIAPALQCSHEAT